MAEDKRLFVKSYGCQMNVYDSERMVDALAVEGYRAVDSVEDADLVILNTCHIREKASEKVYSELGRLRVMAEGRGASGRGLRIGVAGCVAQAEGGEIIRRQPLVDFVVGPQAYHRLPHLLARSERGERALVDTEFPAEDKFDHLPRPDRPHRGATAFLTVQEGCDKFCSFCVVPYTRGVEVSRPVTRILAEARDLVARGVVEITLLGQNVNAFHGDGPEGRPWSLARLVAALADIEGLARIRYTTSHPNDMRDDLIEAHAAIPQLMPYLHLPVQSGSDAVLKAMNRRHTAQQYLDLIARIRAARPDIAISGDFIVGFPGETEADFEDTMTLARSIGYAHAYSFKYSPRPGTPASTAIQIDEALKVERLARLQLRLTLDQAAYNAGMVGRTMPVMVERPGREAGQVLGRTPYLQPVQFAAPAQPAGAILDVTIEEARPNGLVGALAGPLP